MEEINIRQIRPQDDPEIAKVIRDVLIEHNVPKVGTAYADPQLDYMYRAYDHPYSVYFVVEKEGKIIGGAGIAHLEKEESDICELQKMYFLREARGLGLGTAMMQKCLEAAKDFGYTKCYLETMPYMTDAQKLYQKSGFHYISAPMGNTGHNACPVWMLRKL
ncbi:MAG TPA: GNAT family N-acetyltransferase [Flavobacterium sp.]|jgi:putative acetyltransferase